MFEADGEEVKICRICFEPETRENAVITPCDCSGSQKYVHHRCLSTWQATVLFQETSSVTNETRHFICNTCGGDFHGLSIPTRKRLLSSVCGEEIATSLLSGSFLVASRSNSERGVSTNFPALVEALLKLKRAHWKYGVYFIISFGVPGIDDLEGDSKVFALNLTRVMDGSADRPIPDEVLMQQQSLRGAQTQPHGGDLNSEDAANTPTFPRVTIRHHNGGPVKWSSYRSGMLVVECGKVYLQEQLRQRGFVSEGTPGALFLTSFMLMAISESSTLLVGKFSVVMDIVRDIQHLFADDSDIVVFSYSGFAEWTKAQLLREVARGSWAVVRPDTALAACEKLLNPSASHRVSSSDSACASAYPSAQELSSGARVASHSVRQSRHAGDTVEEELKQHPTKYSRPAAASVAMSPDELPSSSQGSSMDVDVDEDEEDDLPPIPLSAKRATRSITRARSASNTPAMASACADDIKTDDMEEGGYEEDGSSLGPPKLERVRGSLTRARSASNCADTPYKRATPAYTRARSASNTAAMASAATSTPDHDEKEEKSNFNKSVNATCKEAFSDIEEGNLWEKMIDISIESGDNIIKQSYRPAL